MSGIDKIIAQIENDTKSVCDETIDLAKSKAEAVISSAFDEAETIKTKSEEKTALKLKDIKARGESSADLEEKKVRLKTKQDIISVMLKNALKNAKELSDDEYFTLLLKMVEKNARDEKGVMRLSSKDLSRLPKGFSASLEKVSGKKLTLSDEPIEIDAGFVLIYGGIEENCSFDAIFKSEYENLSDKATSLLF